jgi:hypothetical protein
VSAFLPTAEPFVSAVSKRRKAKKIRSPTTLGAENCELTLPGITRRSDTAQADSDSLILLPTALAMTRYAMWSAYPAVESPRRLFLLRKTDRVRPPNVQHLTARRTVQIHQ